MALLVYERFPKLIHQGRQLIWDSRQEISAGPEDVFLLSTNSQILGALRARPQARTVGTLGSGADLETEDPRRTLGEWAHEACGRPSALLKMAAITGTNGKTTSVEILRALLVGAGLAVLQVGTLGVSLWRPGQDRAESTLDTGFTTPEAPAFHALLASARAVGVEACVFECSSHALKLERVAGLDVDVGVFTNLSQDHLDFHGSLDQYAAAKAKLFFDLMLRGQAAKTRTAVLNVGDVQGKQWSEGLSAQLQLRTYERGSSLKILENTDAGLRLELYGQMLRTRLVGSFNAENVAGAWLAAQALLLAEEVPDKDKTLRLALESCSGTRGRLERVGNSRIFVDYAHTPDALEKTLSTLKALGHKDSQLWVLFGCGGERDAGKRPLMGEVAARLADGVMVSSDNPRGEDPLEIIDQIMAGIPQASRQKVEMEPDRRLAIFKGVQKMQAHDVLVICGKGHETYQIVKGQRFDFDDVEVARQALQSKERMSSG